MNHKKTEDVASASEITKQQLVIINDITELEEKLSGLVSQDKSYALLQLDINGFKTLNRVYGEDRCNALLQYIQDFLAEQIQAEAYLYRFTDVFTLCLEYTSRKTVTQTAKLWCRKLHAFEDISFRVSAGMYFIPKYLESPQTMLDKVLLARRSIKENALCYLNTYESGLQTKTDEINLIENRMHDALKNKEFVLYLQPKYDMFTNKIVGAEALIRWITADGQMIMPNAFIPVFERNGFVVKTDRFIWQEVCKLLRKWQDNGITPVPISVNVSRCNLFNLKFIVYLSHLVDKYKIKQELLELEITESYDHSLSSKVFDKLKKKGFTLLMDDFGSGYSTLNTLHSSEFDVIKLDKGFLSHFMDNLRGKQIISHTITMIQDIGLDVVAEGVETKAQAQFLQRNGCKVVQGFLYSKPLPVNEFEELLCKQKHEERVS